jgi:hypothetical protein
VVRSDEWGSAGRGRSSIAAALFEAIAGWEVGTHENVGAMKAKFGICTAIATIIFNIGAAPLVPQAPTSEGRHKCAREAGRRRCTDRE